MSSSLLTPNPPPKNPGAVSFRTDDVTWQRIERLSEKLNATRSEVIVRGLALLAEAVGLEDASSQDGAA